MPVLLVIEGPTGVGKTEVTLRLAEHLGCPIVNADSRQIYRELPIGTAAPTKEQQERVRHYFVGTHTLSDNYNAGLYEADVINLLSELFKTHKVVVLSGGSMLYVNAVCNGLDRLPTIKAQTREQVQSMLQTKGLKHLQDMLLELDPDYYHIVDLNNPQRVCHALEVCLESGQQYSSLRTQSRKERPFNILRVALNRDREELYSRINQRVDHMIGQGLLEEAERVLAPYDDLSQLPNSLNTVGYRELMQVKTGRWTTPQAIEMIKQNSRRYAKRQLTWLRAQKDIHWININDYETEDSLLNAIYALLP